jgi:hypothetical protein
MTTAISLNYGISAPSTCRVEVLPGTTAVGYNTVMKGGQQYTTPFGVTYRMNGMTITHQDRGLHMPQMRSFLAPEYYNAGCTSLYCKDAQMCPGSTIARPGKEQQDMYDYLFEPQSDVTGNDAPPACFVGGDKYCSYNSVLGWQQTPGSTTLKWQTDGGKC